MPQSRRVLRSGHTDLRAALALVLLLGVVSSWVLLGLVPITNESFAMNSLSFRKSAVGPEHAAKYAFLSLVSRPQLRQMTPRLRRKGPLWTAALVVLFLATDLLLAWLAWIAVDFVVK
jgi:hypothetical protein